LTSRLVAIGQAVGLLCWLLHCCGRGKSIGPMPRTCGVCDGQIIRGCAMADWCDSQGTVGSAGTQNPICANKVGSQVTGPVALLQVALCCSLLLLPWNVVMVVPILGCAMAWSLMGLSCDCWKSQDLNVSWRILGFGWQSRPV
jgi:hypothetical protein